MYFAAFPLLVVNDFVVLAFYLVSVFLSFAGFPDPSVQVSSFLCLLFWSNKWGYAAYRDVSIGSWAWTIAWSIICIEFSQLTPCITYWHSKLSLNFNNINLWIFIQFGRHSYFFSRVSYLTTRYLYSAKCLIRFFSFVLCDEETLALGAATKENINVLRIMSQFIKGHRRMIEMPYMCACRANMSQYSWINDWYINPSDLIFPLISAIFLLITIWTPCIIK